MEDDNIRVYQPLDMETAPSIYGCILVTVQLHLMMLETPHHHHVCQPHGYSKKSFALVRKYIGEGGPTLVLIVTNSTFPGSTQQSAFLLSLMVDSINAYTSWGPHIISTAWSTMRWFLVWCMAKALDGARKLVRPTTGYITATTEDPTWCVHCGGSLGDVGSAFLTIILLVGMSTPKLGYR